VQEFAITTLMKLGVTELALTLCDHRSLADLETV
jgi:hypothetical protein